MRYKSKTDADEEEEEVQTTQRPKEKEQRDKQQYTKHTHKTKNRVTRTPLKPGGELRCSGRETRSSPTSGHPMDTVITMFDQMED